MIPTKTLDKGQGIGSGFHDETKYFLTKILYNIPIKYEEETIEQKDKENYLGGNQNIVLRMLNETPVNFYGLCGNIKSIWIDFPNKITTSQVEFLKQLEQQYGEYLKQISIKQQQEIGGSLIGFKQKDASIIEDHTFKSAIIYAEQYLVDNSLDIICEDIIIGKTLNIQKQK